MMIVWKFGIDITDRQTIAMPVGAQLLTVQTQMGGVQIWALCDENQKASQNRVIAIYGTGNPMPDDPGAYIATFQIRDGAVVFHAFDASPPPGQ